MRIALISDHGSAGGAGIAATRLARNLKRRGHRVGGVYQKGHELNFDAVDDFYPLELDSEWTGRITTVLKNELWRRHAQKKWVEVFARALKAFRPDLISLHNLHGAGWDIEVVEECLRHAPVVWTMHDMWAVTGSCMNSMGCRKFERACDAACPQVGTYPTLPAHMIKAAHRRRRRLYASHPRLTLVTPSRWLAADAEKMVGGAVHVRRVSNGFCLDTFKPGDKPLSRRILGLPDGEPPMLLAIAASLDATWKGMATLAQALTQIDSTRYGIMFLGKGGRIGMDSTVRAYHVGSYVPERLLPLIYSAADLFVHPSHAENQCLVVMEAMACGLPVVGLPIAGVRESVRDGETGWLARDETPGALGEAIKRAIASRDEWPKFSERGRQVARAEFGDDLQVVRYEMLFEGILSGKLPAQAEIDAADRSRLPTFRRMPGLS